MIHIIIHDPLGYIIETLMSFEHAHVAHIPQFVILSTPIVWYVQHIKNSCHDIKKIRNAWGIAAKLCVETCVPWLETESEKISLPSAKNFWITLIWMKALWNKLYLVMKCMSYGLDKKTKIQSWVGKKFEATKSTASYVLKWWKSCCYFALLLLCIMKFTVRD